VVGSPSRGKGVVRSTSAQCVVGYKRGHDVALCQMKEFMELY
jgi:hypothetical protein